MSCTNCFNGCAETISDQCVKYTGIDIPALGIHNGDNLLAVENAITTFLVPAINGTGIKPIIDPTIICNIVKSYLPACTTCTGFTLNELLTAIVKSICDIQTQINTINSTLNTLNADYTIGCLTGVTASSDTHAIVQAVINNLCSLNSAFSILVANLPNTYVAIANFTTLIQDYLDSVNFLGLAKDIMVPYAAIPYFGPLSNYPSALDSLSLTGQGTGYWQKVYLCNGLNGTPDLRGRTLVGVTTGMGGAGFPSGSPVNPATPGVPDYTISVTTGLPVTEYGDCIVTLGVGQIPNHNHPGSTVAITDPEHYHNVANGEAGTSILVEETPYLSYFGSFGGSSENNNYYFKGTADVPDRGRTSSATTGITATPTIAGQGGGDFHNNVQPSRASFYIMYIP